MPCASAGMNGSGRRLAHEGDRRQLVGRRRDRVGVRRAARLAWRGRRSRHRGSFRPGGGDTGIRSRSRSCRHRHGVPRTGRARRSSDAVSSRPSVVTTSTSRRLSIVIPCLRISQPMPPLSVRPAMPTAATSPPGVASPCSCAPALYSPQVRPASADATRRSGSTSSRFIAERSTTSPRSTVPYPAGLWPPPRTASGRSWLRAKLDGLDDVGDLVRTHDQRRPAVDGRIPDPARRVVLVIAGVNHPSPHPRCEGTDRGLREGRACPDLSVRSWSSPPTATWASPPHDEAAAAPLPSQIPGGS